MMPVEEPYGEIAVLKAMVEKDTAFCIETDRDKATKNALKKTPKEPAHAPNRVLSGA